MAKTFDLTWDKARKRWKKKYRGQQLYFPFGDNKGDRNGYEQALAAWHVLKAQIDARPVAVDPDDPTARVDVADWVPSYYRQAKKKAVGRTVGECLAVFGRTFQLKADAGQLAKSNVQSLCNYNKAIGKLLGTDRPVVEIDGQVILEVHSSLLADLAAKKRAARSVRTLMGHLKRFVRWLAATDAIPKLPSILLMKDNGDLSFKVPQKKILTFTIPEVEQLLGSASERTKLYLLLALNCGMTQVDIADLAPSEVNWKAGTITRKRSKECNEPNVPTVTWKLWSSTLKLLKAHRDQSGDRVLTNEVGGPLRSWDNDKNKDNVRSAFERLMRKEKIKDPKGQRRTFKSLRKTASTILGSSKDYARHAQYFLGHAPDNTADSFYVVPSQDAFNEAVLWLGQQLGQ